MQELYETKACSLSKELTWTGYVPAQVFRTHQLGLPEAAPGVDVGH